MTDEERKNLCEKLRDPGDDPFTFQIEVVMEQAADEIERLVKENARLVVENSQLKTELDDS